MPRNGQGVYSLPPVYEAVTGETIEAQQHNVPLEDIAADLNAARSVATGGTGGQSATQARTNLDVYSKAETDEKIEGMPSGAPIKETPVDADGVLISDSADDGKPKRVLWSKIKALINVGSVGAAIAAANGKATPADGDFFAGVEAGGSTMFKTTWANIKAALAAIHYSKTEVNNIVAGNMAGRAYPRRSDGGWININWSDPGGQETYIIGSTDGYNYRPVHRSSLSVNYANIAGTATTVGSFTQAEIQNQLNWRLTDTRFAGYIENYVIITPTGNFDTRVVEGNGYTAVAIWTSIGNRNLNVGLRQPQVHIPNVGWRALGNW